MTLGFPNFPKRANMNRLIVLLMSLFLLSCDEGLQETDYDPKGSTDTRDRPIQYQVKRTFRLDDGAVSFSNEFSGARLNSVTQVTPEHYKLTILPENEPINKSPWYAFRVQANSERDIIITLEYPGYKHRYVPKTSSDLRIWTPIDSHQMSLDTVTWLETSPVTTLRFPLRIGPEASYVAAQELLPADSVYAWEDQMIARHEGVKVCLGFSRLGKPIHLMNFGNLASRQWIFIMGRQHPPEVSGYLASQAFLETILKDNELANKFREQYRIAMVPMLNPDGIDNGHWRHSAGGVDLNRDWASFHQPETKLISEYLDHSIAEGIRVDFAIDFHSTDTDMYYIFTDDMPTHKQGFTAKWLSLLKEKLPGYEPDTEATDMNSPSAKYYFFNQLRSEFVTFEVGDETSRDEVNARAVAGAEAMMQLLTADQ